MADRIESSSNHGNVGLLIRQRRRSRSLTLVQLSDLSGVSRAGLSKIERGEISPTYQTLRKIAYGMNLTIAQLISDASAASVAEIEVVRSRRGGRAGNAASGYKSLAGKAISDSVHCFVAEVSGPPPKSDGDLHTHNTEDILFVLHGRIECHFEGRSPIQLNEGDSLFYPGSIPHAFSRVEEGEPAEDTGLPPPSALWISKPIPIDDLVTI